MTLLAIDCDSESSYGLVVVSMFREIYPNEVFPMGIFPTGAGSWQFVATEVFRQLCYSNLTALDDWEWIGSLWFFDLLLVDEMSVGIMSTIERSQRSRAKVVKTGAMKWVATSLINLCHKRKKLPTSFFVPASESQKNAAAMKIKFSIRGYVI